MSDTKLPPFDMARCRVVSRTAAIERMVDPISAGADRALRLVDRDSLEAAGHLAQEDLRTFQENLDPSLPCPVCLVAAGQPCRAWCIEVPR